MDDILFCSHRVWAFNPEYDFAKKHIAHIAADKIGVYVCTRGAPVLVYCRQLGWILLRFDNKNNSNNIKREGFDDRVRLRVNGEDRFSFFFSEVLDRKV